MSVLGEIDNSNESDEVKLPKEELKKQHTSMLKRRSIIGIN